MVTEDLVTIAHKQETRRLQQQTSSSSLPERLQGFAVERKIAIVLADSMGECFELDDQFTLVVKPAYQYEWIARDVVDGVVNINRHRNIIIWAGAHSIHQVELDKVEADLRGLINVIVPRNRKATIYISTLVPKPRENHLTAPRFQRFNEAVQKVALEFQKTGLEVFCLLSDRVFLDHRNDIVRPITQNFDDGFHLNRNGATRLKDYWLGKLLHVDYVWHL